MIHRIYNRHKETIHDFLWRSLQIGAKQGITFLIFILCAKLLTPYDFGIYNYALTIIFFLIMFGDFGVSTATSKYVAEYNATDKEKLKSVLFNSGIIILGLTIFISALTLIIGPWYLKDKYIYVLYLLPLIFLAPMTSLYDGIYRGLKKFKSLAIISLIIGFLSLGFVYFLIQEYGLIGALIAQDLFYFILLLGLSFGYRELNFKVNKQIMKSIWKYSFSLGVAYSGYYLFSRTSVFILGYYNYFSEIAIYEILNKIFGLISLPLGILATTLAPDIAINYSKKEYNKLYLKFKKYTKYSLIVTLVLDVILLFITPLIVKRFFSEYYIREVFYKLFIPVLGIYTFLIYSTIINNLIILSSKFAKIDMYLKIILAALNLPISLILINKIGYIGPIYSMFFITSAEVVFLNLFYYPYIKSKLDSNN